MFQANMFSVQGRTVRVAMLFVAVIQDRFQFKSTILMKKFESSCSILLKQTIHLQSRSLLERWSFKNVIL